MNCNNGMRVLRGVAVEAYQRIRSGRNNHYHVRPEVNFINNNVKSVDPKKLDYFRLQFQDGLALRKQLVLQKCLMNNLHLVIAAVTVLSAVLRSGSVTLRRFRLSSVPRCCRRWRWWREVVVVTAGRRRDLAALHLAEDLVHVATCSPLLQVTDHRVLPIIENG